MAVIGNIQKNSVLLLIVIGLAMLAFIFTDFLKDPGGQVEQINSATVNGEGINEVEFERLKTDFITRDRNNALSQNQEYSKSSERASEDKAFNELVRKTLLDDETDKLGIVVTKDEMNDMIHGKNIHPWVLQVSIFNGASGFSKDSVRNFLSNLENEPTNEADIQQWTDARRQWKEFEDGLRTARVADKYVALVRKGVYVNKVEVEDKNEALFHKRKFKYVVQKYAAIPEDEVSISDDEVKAYFEKHKGEKKYEQEEARSLDMVFIPVSATANDRAITRDLVSALIPNLKTTENVLQFIYQNSDEKIMNDTLQYNYSDDNKFVISGQGGTYPKSIDEEVQKGNIGQVFGPITAQVNSSGKSEEHVALARLLDVKKQKQAWVRHILISSQSRSEDAAKSMADSIMNIIRSKNNFVEMVSISEDPASIPNNGEYKWFPEGRMVPEFNDAAFNGPVGKLQLVKTDYGYHIVEVIEQAERNVPVFGIVTKKIKPSDKTLADMEMRLFDFIFAINDVKATQDSAFIKIAQDSGFQIQSAKVILANNFIPGVTTPDRVMRFAFNKNAKMNDVSDPILDGDKFIVANIKSIIEEGVPTFEEVELIVKRDALKEKQANFYIDKMSGKQGIDAVATVLTDGAIRETEVTFDGQSVVKGQAKDPALVGSVFTDIPVGAMTNPIKGKDGVYVFILEEEELAPKVEDYEKLRGSLLTTQTSVADGAIIEALREKADLKDNRQAKKYQQ